MTKPLLVHIHILEHQLTDLWPVTSDIQPDTLVFELTGTQASE